MAKILSRSNETASSKFYIKTRRFQQKIADVIKISLSHYDPIFEKISPDF